MAAASAGSRPESSEKKKEEWSLVSAAFGAVTGTILSILIQPLAELLPGKLFEEFVSKTVEITLSVGLVALFGYIATRVRRLDLFLRRYLFPVALAASLLLALSLWARAGQPQDKLPLAVIGLTLVETCFFLLFCGGAIQSGLRTIAGKQLAEYERQREADAQRIAAGAPEEAPGIFGLNAAGALGQAMRSGCLLLLLLVFQVAAIWTVSALDAHVLFHSSRVWSVIAGAIIAGATLQVVVLSHQFGEEHSESVPLEEKYEGILPAATDDSKKS